MLHPIPATPEESTLPLSEKNTYSPNGLCGQEEGGLLDARKVQTGGFSGPFHLEGHPERFQGHPQLVNARQLKEPTQPVTG